MTKNTLLSVRISQRLNTKLEKLAKLTGRTKSWLVDSILAERVDPEIEFAELTLKAEREAERVGTTPRGQVVELMRAKPTSTTA